MRREIELLYIFRFKENIEANVLQQRVDPNIRYAHFILQKLSNVSKVGVISTTDPNMTKFLGLNHRDTEFGKRMEFLIWVSSGYQAKPAKKDRVTAVRRL